MRDIVSNATPLIYLAKIRRLSLLKKLFSEVYVPEEVKFEAVDRGKALDEQDAYVIEEAIKEGWLKVSKAKMIEVPIKLEPGEAAVLSLAKSMGITEVLMDELSARTVARLLGLTPRGTVFVLLKALEEGEISLNEFTEALTELVRQGFRLREEVYLEAMKKAQEIGEK